MTLPGRDADGEPALTYRLAHAPTGDAIEGTMPLLLSKNDAQGQGSAITYARRYALCAVLNLVADDDDDGARAAAGRSQQTPRNSPDLATPAQKKFLRQLVTQHSLKPDVMDTLLRGVEFTRGEGEKVNDAINRLTRGQCSTLIETIKDGPVRTGESDATPPDAGSEFVHEPADPDETFERTTPLDVGPS
jgi:hypothetical protein